MKTSFTDLSKNWQHKNLVRLKSEMASGKPLLEFTRDERDLLHMETSEDSLLYWKAEGECAENDERCRKCQLIARSILVTLRSLEPPVEDTDYTDNVLEAVLAEAAHLPATH